MIKIEMMKMVLFAVVLLLAVVAMCLMNKASTLTQKVLVFGIFNFMIAGTLGYGFKYIQQCEFDIRGNYTVYLDGNEVDRDKIDLDLYKKSYDDENGIIYITAKTH